MFTAEIVVHEGADNIRSIVKKELVDKDRAQVTLRKSGKKLVFSIKAKDATALKITLNSITKYLIIYEKAGSMKWTSKLKKR